MTQKKKSADIWLETAYQLFADVGPDAINVKNLSEKCGLPRTNFYYHFADKNDLIDRLLNDHLAKEVAEFSNLLQTRFNKFIPDLYDIVVENQMAVKFHWQLFKNRDDIRYNQVFLHMRKKNSEFIIPKVMEYYRLDLPPFLIQSIWDTVNDAWFSKLDFNNFTSPVLSKIADDMMKSVLAFAKHQVHK
ncbi:MAG: TetR/AcrR family transcriptional regulator [Bacteroidales bacterium]|nr:TetR/AcrR family transcriptional regulator [Bacteroidales bacterium]